MKNIIEEKLVAIEEKENVKIILAVESGSRAWGFESQDSDYDVRFIYVRKEKDYLKLEGMRDVIEWQLDDVLDINGWDIQKALKLMYKSNPTLTEWCHSPIIYRDAEEARDLIGLLPSYFSRKKSLFHYWHMASTNYRDYLKSDKVKAKKYFYVVRPILAAKWIIAYDTIPPIEFDVLANQLLDKDINEIIQKLLVEKKKSSEVDLIDRIDTLNAYIEAELNTLEEIAKTVEDEKTNQWEQLNDFFLSLLEL